jgi:hypothetical protein
MPLTYEVLADEPIIVLRYSGPFSSQDLMQGYSIVVQEMGHLPHTYRLIDFSQATSTFPEVIVAIKTAGAGLPGSMSAGNATTVIVGTNQWVRLAQDFMKSAQFGGLHIPIFNNHQDALATLRTVIAEHQSQR